MTDIEGVIVYSRPMSSLLFDSVTVFAGVLPQEQKLLFVLDLITRAKRIYFGLQQLDIVPFGHFQFLSCKLMHCYCGF